MSGKEPSNWCSLVVYSSEHITIEKYDIAYTWYEGGVDQFNENIYI